MDIEGGELEALSGASEIIRQYRPILAISIYHNARQFFGVKKFVESLGLNYTFKILKLSVFHPSDEIYLLAIPK